MTAAEIKEAGLRFASDEKPGISRKARGKSFAYSDKDGKAIRDAETLRRIKSLVIPPAWERVWISPDPRGHIQATGRDARGRKQYRYHADWRSQRDETKFERMAAFARALPRIRRRVKRDLAQRAMSRENVLATVVRLLETTLIRVGNDEYARQNHSYGLTTMRNRHARVKGTKIEFSFRGKSGKRHVISLSDPQLARIVKGCQDLPGQDLFEYEDENGAPHAISSHDVNAYLHSISDAEFTAKDFRTWAGTVLAATALREFEKVMHVSEAKKNVVTAIEAVAQILGNTPAVCRKCYIHPEIMGAYMDGETIATIEQRAEKMDASLSRLKPEEAAVLVLLQRRLQQAKRGKSSLKEMMAKSVRRGSG